MESVIVIAALLAIAAEAALLFVSNKVEIDPEDDDGMEG